VLARLARVLERACDDISLPQYRVLVYVSEGDERASRLADRLALAKPTITAAVDGLVERGYVVREAIEGNRRSIRLRVTPAGDAALDVAEAAMVDALGGAFECVTDRGALLHGLAELHDAWITRVNERLGAVRP
jgi:DNA-binding MarR family transcriptional regulator